MPLPLVAGGHAAAAFILTAAASDTSAAAVRCPFYLLVVLQTKYTHIKLNKNAFCLHLSIQQCDYQSCFVRRLFSLLKPVLLCLP